MSKPNVLAQLAEFYETCQSAARYLDPEVRTQEIAKWVEKLPPNQQRLVNDAAPVLAKLGKQIAERRVPRFPGGNPNASR